MPHKRKRSTPSVIGGASRRKSLGLVATQIEWPPEARLRAKTAMSLAGYNKLQEFLTAVIGERVTEILKQHGVKDNQKKLPENV